VEIGRRRRGERGNAGTGGRGKGVGVERGLGHGPGVLFLTLYTRSVMTPPATPSPLVLHPSAGCTRGHRHRLSASL